MLKKLTPLLILGLFALSAFFMKIGMDNAIELSKPKKEETTKEISK